MLFLSNIINASEENCINTMRLFLTALKLKVSRTGAKTVKEHPDYPSMLSISDTLKKWDIESLGLKVPVDKIAEVPTPFIAQIKTKGGGELFTVVKTFDGNNFTTSNPVTQSWKKIPKKEFLEDTTGMVLLVEAGEHGGEKQYSFNRRKERWQTFIYATTIATILVLSVFAISSAFHIYGAIFWAPSILLLLKLVGSYISFLLLWYEVDSHNPVLQQVCQRSKRINCGAIIKSDAAKILGFSWSEIGSFYFFGSLVALLAGMLSPEVVLTICWLNVVALPYTIFSIYYQWRIAKQWCLLCLTVQAILVSEFLVSFSGGLHTIAPSSSLTRLHIAVTALCFLAPVLCWFLIKPLLHAGKENTRSRIALTRLKYNPEIFEALLKNQKSIEHSTTGLGITIGNPNAATKIIKVCNPYCGPCARAHGLLDELIENSDIQLQIIFTTANDDNNAMTRTTKHLMAIAAANNESITSKALSEWYGALQKDYELFAAKYPLNGEVEAQGAKLEAMKAWCNETKITYTPTIFINGYRLSQSYDVSDLKYFLS